MDVQDDVITVGEYAHDAAMRLWVLLLENSHELAESFLTIRDMGIVLRVRWPHQGDRRFGVLVVQRLVIEGDDGRFVLFDLRGFVRMSVCRSERDAYTKNESFDERAVSKVKRNGELSELKYQVEKQVQACWRRLQTASGMHVW